MGILGRLLHPDHPDDAADAGRVGETVERVMKLHPHLRLARRCEARLAPAVATALAYTDALAASLPAAREASAAAWAADPYIHAYFVAPDDVASAISRSANLRAHFEHCPDAPEAFAVLGMQMTERHILGVGLEGGSVRRDVPQTTVSFSDHQVRLCGRSDADLRAEIVERLLDQLALEGLARIGADESRRDMLERERGLLGTRRQLLERQGAGIRAMLGSEAAPESAELARLQEQIDENERNLAGLGLREHALDRELDHVRALFAEPARHLFVTTKRLRMDRMNVVIEDNSTQDAEEFEFHVARVPGTPPLTRAFSPIRFARADLLPAKSMLDEAGRLLSSGLLS
jgi:hypothetical protein